MDLREVFSERAKTGAEQEVYLDDRIVMSVHYGWITVYIGPIQEVLVDCDVSLDDALAELASMVNSDNVSGGINISKTPTEKITDAKLLQHAEEVFRHHSRERSRW